MLVRGYPPSTGSQHKQQHTQDSGKIWVEVKETLLLLMMVMLAVVVHVFLLVL